MISNFRTNTTLLSIAFLLLSSTPISLLSVIDDGDFPEGIGNPQPNPNLKKTDSDEQKRIALQRKKEAWRNRDLTKADVIDMTFDSGKGAIIGGIVGGVAHTLVTSASTTTAVATTAPVAAGAIVAAGETAVVTGGAAVAAGKVAVAGAAKVAVAVTGTAISLPAAIALGATAGTILGCSWAFNKWKEVPSE